MTNKPRIAVLAGPGDTLTPVVHALNGVGDVVAIVREEKEPLGTFLKRRIKKLGVFTVLGQVLFVKIVPPILSRLSKKRLKEIRSYYTLDESPIENSRITDVRSVNDEQVAALLKEYRPDVVVLHGTRIVKKHILESVPAHVLNIHAGMTPMYRGVHGGYWALASGHPEFYGVTVHLVDTGVDTGGILTQVRCALDRSDSFVTYPEVQLGEGLRALVDVIATGAYKPIEIDAPFSRQWYHPTLWAYLWTLVTRRVR